MESGLSLSIFNYSEPGEFLKDAWNKKRAFNKNFTVRAWASQLGISGHANFHQMINGKRPIPKKYALDIAKSLSLSPKEAMYFETLIDFKKARTLKLKAHYSDRLKELAPGPKLNLHEIESFRYLKNPLNGAIIELTSLKDFKCDPLWIKERLTLPATINEIKKSLELMLSLNLIKEDDGKLKPTHKHLYTKQDVSNEALREYHKNIMKHATQEIENQDVTEREFNASAFGIKKEDMPKAKERIREFMQNFIKEFESDHGQAEEIYQLGIQFFGLSKNNKEKLQ